jgi:hypothetical protein
MQLNHYTFKTSEVRTVKALIKGLLLLAGPCAVERCTGLPSPCGSIYCSLSTPLPPATIRAMMVALAGSGLDGAEQMVCTLSQRPRADVVNKVESVPTVASPTEPESGHPRFDPNQFLT